MKREQQIIITKSDETCFLLKAGDIGVAIGWDYVEMQTGEFAGQLFTLTSNIESRPDPCWALTSPDESGYRFVDFC